MLSIALLLSACPAPQSDTTPPIPAGVNAKSWRDAAKRVKGFRFDKKNLTIRLFANKDQVQDPAAICFDDQNRLYVAENHRLKRGGVDDNRQRQFWFLDDISCQTVEDRLAMYKKWESKYPASHYTKYSERIITLEDRDGDGMAEHRVVYADKFNDPLDGPAIGLIAKEGKVYLTCIPHVWVLEDTDSDGVADKRRSIQGGFGVRVSLSGHDMHGLAWGPDGRLYWSIGDRGYNFTTKEGRHFENPASGAVFRCNPDGSDVEIYHEGLRNPQELAFDQFGNLFTVDNNADLGDKARVVYILEGGTSGWHSGFQNLTTFRSASKILEQNNQVPWMVEKIWATQHKGRPAYALPPLPDFTINGKTKVSGPSGLVFHSTGAMGDALANAFYVCDFRGRASRSGIFTFKVENNGAGFKVTEHAEFLGGVATPDIDFSYGGKMYIADWFGGWTVNDQGNIYTVHNSKGLAKPYVNETKELFATGFHKQSTGKLTDLLAHVDMRVRIRAQYELAKRGDEGHKALLKTALAHEDVLARLHGIWGTGQLGRQDKKRLDGVVALLDDRHPEVRANTLRVLGEARYSEASEKMIALLEDENLRVRSLAAEALGKLGTKDALGPLLKMLVENDDKDCFLRHAGLHAIARIDSKEFVYNNLKHDSKAARLAMLLVLRRWKDPKISMLLDDRETFVAEEAARAIHDLCMVSSEANLAARLASLTDENTPLTHQRVINSNFRLGKKSHANRLLAYCQKPLGKHERGRVEAMHLLGVWDKPHKVDRVVGLIRAYPGTRDDITDVIHAELPKLLTTAKGTVAAKAIDLASKYKLKLDSDVLLGVILNPGLQTDFRVSSINNLLKNNPGLLLDNVGKLITDKQPAIRALALKATLLLKRKVGLGYLMEFLNSKNAPDRQAAYKNLGNVRSKEISDLLVTRLNALIAGSGVKESRLELVEACAQSKDPGVSTAYAGYVKGIGGDPLAPFKVALYGGDRAKGQELVKTHGIAQCIRCHRLDHRDSTGPGLRHIGKKDRAYLLRSLITPSSEITEGYGTVAIETKGGENLVGVLTKSDKKFVTLKMEKKTRRIKKADIVSQSKPISAMVPMGSILTKEEIRDIIEFLSTLTR
jgi:quinoprotein glucose dehydrogenase